MKTVRLMVFATILFLVAAFHQAHAQVIPPCLPALNQSSLTASPIYSGVTKNGAWVYWFCYTATTRTQVTYVGSTAELSKVGSRIQTILKAIDPLRSLQTAGSRFPILPLTDPSLAAVVADMEAAVR